MGMVDLPRTVNGRERGSEVGKNTSQAKSVGLTGDGFQRECILDGFLEDVLVVCAWMCIGKRLIGYHVLLDASHHVGIPLSALLHANFAKNGMGRRGRGNSLGVSLELVLCYFSLVLGVDLVHWSLLRGIASQGQGQRLAGSLGTRLGQGAELGGELGRNARDIVSSSEAAQGSECWS